MQYGWSLYAVAISFLLGTIVNRLLMQKLTGVQIASIGLVIIVISVFILLIISFFPTFNLPMLLIPILMLQMGSALFSPYNATKAIELFPKNAGAAAAIFGCSIFLGGCITSSVLSILPKNVLLPLVSIFSVVTFFMVMAHQYILHYKLLTKEVLSYGAKCQKYHDAW